MVIIGFYGNIVDTSGISLSYNYTNCLWTVIHTNDGVNKVITHRILDSATWYTKVAVL